MFAATLGALVWAFILQHLTTIAQSVAQNLAADEFKKLISTYKLGRKVENAVGRAYNKFRSELDDPQLLTAIERDERFASNQEVAKVLAQAALNPQDRDAQVTRLAALILERAQELSPSVSKQRCERAARLLIEKIHREIRGISALREGLQLLETQQFRERLERPDYAPGLYEDIMRDANAIARRLGHHQVTTGHLLYAITNQPHSVAAWTLNQLHITEDQMRAALTIIDPQTALPPGSVAPGATSALERAPDLARERGALRTGTEHVLLALATIALENHGGQTIRGVFNRLGVTCQAVYDAANATAKSQGAVQSAIIIFHGDDAGDSAANPAGGDLPIDARETLPLFGA